MKSSVIEWLAEEDKLRVLCATTTIAQGINFPVSSVFLTSRFVPQGNLSRSMEMAPRDFWNLAGRAGRMQHDSVGVVGLAAGDSAQAIVAYVRRATGELISSLVNMLNNLERIGRLHELESVIKVNSGRISVCYVAHLWNEKRIWMLYWRTRNNSPQYLWLCGLLRASADGRAKADKLLEATRNYAEVGSQSWSCSASRHDWIFSRRVGSAGWATPIGEGTDSS
jgi:hypothetical protein